MSIDWPTCPDCGEPSDQVIVTLPKPTTDEEIAPYVAIFNCCDRQIPVDSHPLL